MLTLTLQVFTYNGVAERRDLVQRLKICVYDRAIIVRRFLISSLSDATKIRSVYNGATKIPSLRSAMRRDEKLGEIRNITKLGKLFIHISHTYFI